MSRPTTTDHTPERVRVVRAVRDLLFDKQREVVFSTAKRNACHTGRRGGKSDSIPKAGLHDVCLAGPMNPIIIGAEQKEKALALHWANLLGQMQDLGLTWRTDSSKGSVTTPWGAWIQFWGMKDRRSSALLRGFKPWTAHFDEVATYDHLLEGMADDDLGPALGDCREYGYGGRLCLWGTPTHSRVGPWFEICEGIRPGWEVFHWDVRSNPHFPNPEKWLAEVLESHGWDETEPTYRREYLGLFVDDTAALVYRFDRVRNVVPHLPRDYDPKRWVHIMAVDFGMKDECAWVVLASHPHRQETFVVHASKAGDMLTGEAAEATSRLVELFDPEVLVGDAGGLGKPYVEEIRRRHGLNMVAAEKTEKRAHIRLLNDDLGTARLRIVEDACQPLITEISSLPWHESRTKEDPRYPNHACDALLYAWRHHRAYRHERPPGPPGPSDPSSDAAIDREIEKLKRDRGGEWF